MYDTDKAMRETHEFWDEIVRNTDGTLNEDAVYAELHDFLHMIHEVPKVYSEITCGQLSKPNYYASAVLDVANDCAEENLRHVIEDIVVALRQGATVDDIEEEYLND